MKLSQTISFDPATLQPTKGLSIDENEDNLGHFSQGANSSDEEEDPEIDKVELMRNLMEKQMKLSENEQRFAKKIESVKTSLKGADIANEFPDPVFKNQTTELSNEIANGNELFKKSDQAFAMPLNMVQSTDPRNYDSRVSKKSDNAFTIKFKEHMVKKGFASNNLSNSKVTPDHIPEIQESVHGSESQSEIDFDNVRSLNFFFEAKEVPKANFYRSHEPQIFTEERIHFQNNLQLAKQQKSITASHPPINLFQKPSGVVPNHYQSLQKPPERNPQSLEPPTHPWTQDPKMVASQSLSQMLKSVDVGSNNGEVSHPFNESIKSDSFDYYQHAHPETEQSSNYESEEVSENSQRIRRQEKIQGQHGDSESGDHLYEYAEGDEDSANHHDQQELEPNENEQEVIYVCSDFHHYNQTYLKKHLPDYVHELIEDTNYKFSDEQVRHTTDTNRPDQN
jgi:hypothetical protein